MLFESTLVVRYKVQIKQKLQRHNNAGVLGGRGWITRAALLKTARRAVFALSLATAPQLFSSTRCVRRKIVQNKKFNALSYVELFWWARVDYASRAAKNSLAGCFCPAGRKAPGRSCSNPPAYVSLTFVQKKTASVSLHQRFFHGAKQPKSEPLPPGAFLAAISSKVMVFVPSL